METIFFLGFIKYTLYKKETLPPKGGGEEGKTHKKYGGKRARTADICHEEAYA